MSCHYDNVRPLVCPPRHHARYYKFPATVIPLHRFRQKRARWRTVGWWFLAFGVSLLIAATAPLAWRSAHAVAGTIIPVWPMW